MVLDSHLIDRGIFRGILKVEKFGLQILLLSISHTEKNEFFFSVTDTIGKIGRFGHVRNIASPTLVLGSLVQRRGFLISLGGKRLHRPEAVTEVPESR